MKISLKYYPLVLGLLISGCTEKPASKSADVPSNPSSPRTNSSNAVYLKFKKHEIIDREGSGMVAFTCLIPEGWTVNDKLYWDYNDATLPIRYRGQFENAKEQMVIRSYPDVRVVYSTGPMGTSGYPPPRGAIPGLKDMIKRERQGIQYQFVHEKILQKTNPKSGYQQGSYTESQSEAAVVRIAYTQNDLPMEEEFYGQLEIATMVSQGVVTLYSTIWAANNLYSVKAPKDKLDACRKIAMTIKSSSRPTLPFYNKFVQVTRMLSDQVYAGIYRAGQISRIISQTNDQVSKSISDSYWQTQKSYDRTNNQFSDYIRGVDRYNDGGPIPVQLPSGWDKAWVNDRGEYLLSLSNGFDPNSTLTGNWKQLEKK